VAKRIQSEIRSPFPGSARIAEIQTERQTDESSVRHARRNRFNHTAGQPTVFVPRAQICQLIAIAPAFWKRAASESACGGRGGGRKYGSFRPVLGHLRPRARAENCAVHRKLDSTYIHSVATVLTRSDFHVRDGAFRSRAAGAPFKRARQRDIHENMAGDIRFRDVARYVQMSLTTLRGCSRSRPVSLRTTIVRCRIERAKTLLVEAKLPISDVA